MDAKPVAAWDQLAETWDTLMGTPGNDYYTVIELPALERLVQPNPGDCALDLATGNGLVAHWMAQKGTSVLATDGSPAMVAKAQARQSKRLEENGEVKVSYQILDVTDPQHFDELIQSRGLGAGGAFDIITMNMAIMDVSTLEHLANALPKLLKRDGAVEYKDNPESGREEVFHSLKMTKYLHVPPYKGVATQSQPHPQLYFHRPMHEIFAPFFKAGLVLDALEEPNFDEAYVKARDLDIGSLRQFTQFPKILAFRMKIA
ncbi:hypothetical protein TRV_04548 [Trichophyton verrucosum HKI 0517]|uniref:Methyltransferase domain-containing protein n=1 Tax=Trichophyton verrucosum (strain HKI 0517) TaxID=663202 RepID=D4DBP7_TRIVH|nr:uncharacterized protein TRV_04548 [Trichophyton verrucosum HKI 0517]EFE40723.1 hypothetical protein TRV_04548 [Trichophyton verrucosum HKI 0517]